MWKREPVIGGFTGGITVQSAYGITGFMVTSMEGAEYQIQCALDNSEIMAKVGQDAKNILAEFLDHLALGGLSDPDELLVTAPDFTLKERGESKVPRAELQGKVVLLNLFSHWCPPCKKAASSFDKLNKEVKEKKLVIFQIRVKAKEKGLINFKPEFHISLPILIDENGSVAKPYGVWAAP